MILTRNSAVAQMMRVTVAPLTRTTRGIDSEVVLTPEAGVPSLCAVSLDNLVTISKQLLERRIVALPADVMDEVFEAIRFTFDMP
jgi:mRNA interferase MazF